MDVEKRGFDIRKVLEKLVTSESALGPHLDCPPPTLSLVPFLLCLETCAVGDQDSHLALFLLHDSLPGCVLSVSIDC